MSLYYQKHHVKRPYTLDTVDFFTIDSDFDDENDTVKIMICDNLSRLKPVLESAKIVKKIELLKPKQLI